MSESGSRAPESPAGGDAPIRPSDPASTPATATSAPDVTLSPSKIRSRRTLWIAGTAAGVFVAIGVWIVTANLPRLLTTPEGGAPASPADTATDARRIHATVLYLSDDGTLLAPMSREVLYGATPAEQVKRIVESLTAPPEGRRSALPAGTTVRSVFLTATGEAYVDLGGAIVTGHPGGSLHEALTVYAIVDTVGINMPDVSAVQILVEGKEVDSLVGHLDLRHPIGKSLDWIEKGQ